MNYDGILLARYACKEGKSFVGARYSMLDPGCPAKRDFALLNSMLEVGVLDGKSCKGYHCCRLPGSGVSNKRKDLAAEKN
jgi:hypothetical protein